MRSLIRSDEAGEELYRGLGDNEDEAVDHLVALARDDYPFEHNTWAGGVKADDVKANKGQALPSESSDEEELQETDREYRQQGGGDDVVHSGEGRGQPSMREGEAPIGGRPTSAGVGDLVRQAAEAFEAQLLPMFEGYMVSMKDHISKELSKLMTEVASANSSIAAVETFVKTELATLRNGTAGVDMYGGDLFSGYSPAMRSPSHGPSSPSRQRNKGTAETRVDAEDSPQIDELDGNAAIGKVIYDHTCNNLLYYITYTLLLCHAAIIPHTTYLVTTWRYPGCRSHAYLRRHLVILKVTVLSH